MDWNCAFGDSQISTNDVLQYRGLSTRLGAHNDDLRKIYGVSDLER
jgi:hypothetical protein